MNRKAKMHILDKILEGLFKALDRFFRSLPPLGRLWIGFFKKWKAAEKERIFIISLSLIGTIVVFVITKGLGGISYLISITSGVLIALLSLLILRGEGEQSVSPAEDIKPKKLLLYILLFCLILAFVLSFKLGIERGFRIAFGSAFVLFLPGFLLTELFFEEIGTIERIALSFALSIAIVPLMIFYLNYLLGVKINQTNVILAVIEIIVVSWIIKSLRPRRLKMGGEKSQER